MSADKDSAAVSLLSDSELRQALLNVGCDLSCDTCCETFFTGAAAREHSCSRRELAALPAHPADRALAALGEWVTLLLSGESPARFAQNGRIEELHRTERGDEKRDPYRQAQAAVTGPADGGTEPAAASESTAIVPAAAAPAAAVTVAQPVIGCPCPEFERAEVRATRVLSAFLDPQQLADFDKHQAFLTTGADSGHLYLLTSRQAPRERLAKVGGRTVYDLTEGRPICVHDWVVPAAEEMLELMLFLQMPGRESYVRALPEAWA